MKKIALFLILACLAAGFLFSQDYSVQTVTGRVLKGTGYDRVSIIEGEVLAEDTIVSVSAGALLVFTDGEHTFTLTPGYTGRVIDAPPVTRIRRGGPAARVERMPASRKESAPEPLPLPINNEVHLDEAAKEPLVETKLSSEHVDIIITAEPETEAEILENK